MRHYECVDCGELLDEDEIMGNIAPISGEGGAICPECGGDAEETEERKCGECGGTGKIVNDGPYSPCGDCNGTGRA